MQLPPPVMEQPPGAMSAESTPGQPSAPEQAPAGSERAGTPPSAQPAISVPIPATVPQQAMPSAPAPIQQSSPTPATPQIADDSDLIEKEWVHKAKQIVERTRDDPYKQSEELTGVKVDYMKKRYNKTIKLSQ